MRYRMVVALCACSAVVGAGSLWSVDRLRRADVSPAAQQRAVETRAELLDAVVETRPPGVTIVRSPELDRRTPSPFPQWLTRHERRMGPFVATEKILYAVLDWSSHPATGSNLPAMLLEHAKGYDAPMGAAQLTLLEATGFGDRTWRLPRDRESEQFWRYSIRKSTQTRSHFGGSSTSSGTGGALVDAAGERNVLARLYGGIDNGATALVRMEYDVASQRMLVELAYLDRTILDVSYPRTSSIIEEAIDPS